MRVVLAVIAMVIAGPRIAAGQSGASAAASDSVTIRLVDVELSSAIQMLSRYLAKPAIAANVPAAKVSLETRGPVGPETVAQLLQGMVEAHGLDFVEDSSFFRIAPKQSPVTPVSSDSEPVVLHVVRLKHARAVDLAGVVVQLFGGATFGGRTGLSSGTLGDDLRRQQAAAGATPAQTPAGSAALRGDATIVPDELSNSLLVRATETDFRLIESAVAELDIRPLQVLIEVLIVEAQNDRSFSLGADLFLPARGADGAVEGTVTGGGLGDMVIRLLKIGHADVDATIRAAESRGHVEIVSRPVLIASNNSEARLLVGSQRPFVQVSRSLPTDTPTRDQVVQYRDVGTRLLVRPTINQDGYVSLLVQQEINAATSEVQFDAPVISTREASTQVLVRDGQTIVIGGLKDQQTERRQSGVPVLSRIPLIGGLFGSASRTSTSTELYLFLTPRILRTDEDADRVTTPRLPASADSSDRRRPH